MQIIQIDEVLLIAWFCVLGAVIGSFLNVVVYRLPKGMSLIVPPSHCPACRHRVRWFDNIPMASWLLLRGRCRDCKAAISARYLLVEGITASMFALLTAVEFTFKGINLPLRETYRTGDLIISIQSNVNLYGILLYHLLLLCTLLAAALIEIDRNQAQRRLFMPTLVIGVIAPLIYPFLRPVPAWASFPDWIGRAVDCGAGLAVGGLLGYIAWRIQRTKSPGGMTWGLLCTGIFLGWQAVCGIACLISCFALIALAFRKRRENGRTRLFALWLYTITFGWILAWSPIADLLKRFVDI